MLSLSGSTIDVDKIDFVLVKNIILIILIQNIVILYSILISKHNQYYMNGQCRIINRKKNGIPISSENMFSGQN